MFESADRSAGLACPRDHYHLARKEDLDADHYHLARKEGLEPDYTATTSIPARLNTRGGSFVAASFNRPVLAEWSLVLVRSALSFFWLPRVQSGPYFVTLVAAYFEGILHVVDHLLCTIGRGGRRGGWKGGGRGGWHREGGVRM